MMIRNNQGSPRVRNLTGANVAICIGIYKSIVVPERGILLEFKDICKGRCVGGYAERVALPFSGWNPGYRNVETVQVIRCTELCCGKAKGHDIESGCGVQVHLRRKLEVS